nr:hypothetical protein [Nocardia terpenica]
MAGGAERLGSDGVISGLHRTAEPEIGDDQVAAGLEDPGSLPESLRAIAHVAQRFEGQGSVEGGVGERKVVGVGQSERELVRQVCVGCRFVRDPHLLLADRDTGDRDVGPAGDSQRGVSGPAADIEELITRRNL